MMTSTVCLAKPTTMYIWMKDGSKTIFQLTDKPRLTFSDSDMIVQTISTSITLPYNQLCDITYNDGSASIEGIKQEGKVFLYDGNDLTFKAGDETLKVMIIRLDGAMLHQLTVRPNDTATLPATTLPKGSYAVVVNGITYKIVKP